MQPVFGLFYHVFFLIHASPLTTCSAWSSSHLLGVAPFGFFFLYFGVDLGPLYAHPPSFPRPPACVVLCCVVFAPYVGVNQANNKVVLPIRPITSVSTVLANDTSGKEPHRRPSRRDSTTRSLAEIPIAVRRQAVRA